MRRDRHRRLQRAASRLPWLVWRITLESRRAIMWALRRSVSANATMTEPSCCDGAEIHLPHQPADDPRAVELGARMRGIEGEARHRQSAAARQRLIDRGGEVAVEGSRRQQAGAGIEQAIGIDRLQRAGQMRLERMLADQRQRVGGNMRRARRQMISRFGRS